MLKSIRKLFIISVIFLGLFFIRYENNGNNIGIAEETDTHKIFYSSEKYRVSIICPEDWIKHVLEHEKENFSVFELSCGEKKTLVKFSKGDFFPFIRLSAVKLKEGVDANKVMLLLAGEITGIVKDFLDKKFSSNYSSLDKQEIETKIINAQEITLNGIQGLKMEDEIKSKSKVLNFTFKRIHYYLRGKDFLYVLDFMCDSKDYQIYQPVFDKVVASLKIKD